MRNNSKQTVNQKRGLNVEQTRKKTIQPTYIVAFLGDVLGAWIFLWPIGCGAVQRLLAESALVRVTPTSGLLDF